MQHCLRLTLHHSARQRRSRADGGCQVCCATEPKIGGNDRAAMSKRTAAAALMAAAAACMAARRAAMAAALAALQPRSLAGGPPHTPGRGAPTGLHACCLVR